MQKVYLLLRQNQQTGPYQLDQLLTFDLSPYDLIWIEGQSAGWYYPQEIDELRPYLPFLKNQTAIAATFAAQPSASNTSQPAAKNVFVSMPGSSRTTEGPATAAPLQPAPVFEEQRRSPEAPTAAANIAAETPAANWSETVRPAPEPRKRTGLPSNKIILGVCLLGLAAFAAWQLQSPTEERQTPVSPLPVATSTAVPAEAARVVSESVVPVQTATGKKRNESTAVKAVTNSPNRQKVSVVQEKKEPVLPAVTSEEMVTVTDVKKTTEEKTATPTETPKEKKRLRDRIAELFGKKPAEPQEEAKPAEDEGGRRQATRREAGSSLAQLMSVRFDIPNDWMMGIKGAKAILTNSSSETLAKALVQVVYYNDEGEVVDKKTISFSNIKSKQKQTVSIPDHQTATKLEYNVISAVGNEPMAFK